MNNPGELYGVVLKPGQGATGKAYSSGHPQLALRLPDGAGGGWDTVYEITPDLAKIIDEKLRWVISMPLKGQDGNPIGVMSVDGLVEDFDVDVLNECSQLLTTYALIAAALIMGY